MRWHIWIVSDVKTRWSRTFCPRHLLQMLCSSAIRALVGSSDWINSDNLLPCVNRSTATKRIAHIVTEAKRSREDGYINDSLFSPTCLVSHICLAGLDRFFITAVRSIEILPHIIWTDKLFDHYWRVKATVFVGQEVNSWWLPNLIYRDFSMTSYIQTSNGSLENGFANIDIFSYLKQRKHEFIACVCATEVS